MKRWIVVGIALGSGVLGSCTPSLESLQRKNWEDSEDRCAAGDLKSCVAAGGGYQGGRGTEKNLQKAFDRYVLGCKPPGFTDGCASLDGVVKALPPAQLGATLPTLEKLCTAGSASACTALADADEEVNPKGVRSAKVRGCLAGANATGYGELWDARWNCTSLSIALTQEANETGPKELLVAAAKAQLLAEMIEMEHREVDWASSDLRERAFVKQMAEMREAQERAKEQSGGSDDTLQIFMAVLGGAQQVLSNAAAQQQVLDQIHARNAARVQSASHASAPTKSGRLPDTKVIDVSHTRSMTGGCQGLHDVCGSASQPCCPQFGLVCRAAQCCQPAQGGCERDSDCCDAPLAHCGGVGGRNVCCYPTGTDASSGYLCCSGMVSPQTGRCL